jgi:phage gp29-like protein
MAENTTQPELIEIATIRRDPFLPVYSGLLQQNDDTLTTRGQGKGIRLYEELERDAKVFSTLNKRKMAVIARPWEVKAASNSALDQRAAEVVRDNLAAINFDDLSLALLDAINKGYAVGEVIWERRGNLLFASKVIPRDQRRFFFGEYYELRLKTQQNMLPGEEMPPRKFIVHSLGAKDGNPYGHGLGSRLFWLVWFKRQVSMFNLTFLDKFGNPTIIGKYPNNQSESRGTLLDAIGAIANDTGIAIPETLNIELMEASRSGNAGYESFMRYLDEQISDCVLGDPEGAKGSGGALASAVLTRNEVRMELVQFDADMLSFTLNNSLVRWISEFNVPGATPPTVWRNMVKVTSADDLKKIAERDQILDQLGYEPDEEYIRDNYGEGWKRKAVAIGGQAVGFAEFKPAPATHDVLLANRLSIEAAPAWDDILQHVRRVVDKADSLESLRDDLLASFADLPQEKLVAVMEMGFSAAALAGINDVNDAT